MISILIFALVVLLIVAVAIYIVRMIPIGQPWQNIAAAIIALIGLLVILQRSGLLHA